MWQLLTVIMLYFYLSLLEAYCHWRTGDAISNLEKYIGKFNSPEVCFRKCKKYTHEGKKPNGATVDAATGQKCYCEFDATSQNNEKAWKSCIFVPGKQDLRLTEIYGYMTACVSYFYKE